ncbi:hypothetical protein IWW34DRAFT_777999 [Fusarium oxysporum f. sp. albedinis]|nr:hypothetical protein IWW34DRAFT_777999 [Fusarium oxysporum f. sp. albedinis]
MLGHGDYKSARPSAFLPHQPSNERREKRRRPDTPPETQSDKSTIEWSPTPPPILRRATEKYQQLVASDRNHGSNKDWDVASMRRPFQPELIRAKITKVLNSVPFDNDQGAYTARNPLICRMRSLISTRTVGCALCAFYQPGPNVDTHKLKRCSHRDEAGEARPWLEMFRHYQAQGGGPGARCSHCRFPLMLCWRTVYREEMDLQYGSEKEAREKDNVWYKEVQCNWVKTIHRFVTSCMVVHGSAKNGGVSRLGGTVLDVMGWQDWRGLEENGPEHIQPWLEETGEIGGLRCPRLLVLFWLLAECSSLDERGVDSSW